MPLLDHFHPPLYPHRSWESVHGAWAVGLISALNQGGLPPEYFAEAQTHVGSRVEVDVGTFHDEPRASRARRSDEGGIAVAEPPRWVVPAAVMSVPITYPDSVEALIYSSATGKTLVAAIELVSPGNKDREDARSAFAAKCATYLREGVGVVIVDIVTSRRNVLHEDLMKAIGGGDSATFDPETGIYTVSYRPVRTQSSERVDIWPTALSVGGELPIVPLPLGTRLCVPLDLNAPYERACQSNGLI